MVKITLATGEQVALDDLPADMVSTIVENRDLLPRDGKHQITFNCAEHEISMTIPKSRTRKRTHRAT